MLEKKSIVILIVLVCITKFQDAKEYDFIVVGGGSAGCVIASRLSENPTVIVLLLEAGGHEDIRNNIPMAFATLQSSEQNWKFKTEPQNNSCLGLKDRRSSWSRGKVLGGTSSINGMVYTRGNKRDFDHWANLGNYGWSYDEVLPYFKKAEGLAEPNLADLSYHGTSGPLTVSGPRYWTASASAFLEGAREIGYALTDVNGKTQTGAMPMMSTTRNGKRCSAYVAYIEPAMQRRNLHIETHAHVLKILIDDKKRAYGVKYSQYHLTHEARANKEVILSAGAINSPQLLMLSGIGPKSHLEDLGIPVIADRPGVGQNMQDQIGAGGLVFTLEEHVGTSVEDFVNPVKIPQYLTEYLVYNRGLLASTTAAEGVAFVKTKYANQTDDWPDVQVLYASISQLTDYGILSKSIIGVSDETWNKYYKPVKSLNSMLLLPNIARPKTRGSIKLNTANAYDHPIIEPNYLSEEDDLNVLVEAIKICIAIGNSTAFRKYGSKLISTVVPGCENENLYSDDYWKCLVRHITLTMYHTVGTAKMGPKDDPMAVVSPELIVYGVEGLRVIDASVMPTVTSSNTNAPVIMIAEKVADSIKKKWN